MQSINQAIDVADWSIEEPQYPEGARVKTLLYCPESPPFSFLHANKRYLFKLSSPRYVEQFWVEIIAYRLGAQMEIIVPPAFVAYNSKINKTGALIEWYLNMDESSTREISTSGGDYCQQYIPGFDRKKGAQHNFETLEQIFQDLGNQHSEICDQWKTYWAQTLTFDALIGNTDRHQDNWCIIEKAMRSATLEMRFAPVFDNGTSLGHEIFSDKFQFYNDKTQLENYIAKGKHHMKWRLNDDSRVGHLELLQDLARKYPQTRQIMLNCLKRVNNKSFNDILDELIAFDVPERLTAERAAFMLKLLECRHERLLNGLER